MRALVLTFLLSLFLVSCDEGGGNTKSEFIDRTTTIENRIPAEIDAIGYNSLDHNSIELVWTEIDNYNTGSYVISNASGLTAPSDCSSGVESVNKTFDLTGLDSDTIYTVRVCSKSNKGKLSSGKTYQFSTTAPPVATITNLVSNTITFNSANITWDTDDTNWDKFLYNVQTFLSSSCGVNTSVVKNVSLSGLSANTTYYVNVCAEKNDGTTSSPTTVSFTTSVALEANIVTLNTAFKSIGSVRVSFSNNNSRNNFKIVFSKSATTAYCTQTTGGDTTSLDFTNSNATVNYDISNLDLSTDYYIRVCSYNSAGVLNQGTTTVYSVPSYCGGTQGTLDANLYNSKYYICNNSQFEELVTHGADNTAKEYVVGYDINTASLPWVTNPLFDTIDNKVIDFNNQTISNLDKSLIGLFRNSTIKNLTIEDYSSSSNSLIGNIDGTGTVTNLYFKSGTHSPTSHYNSLIAFDCETGGDSTETSDTLVFSNINIGTNFVYKQNTNNRYYGALFGRYVSQNCTSITLNDIYWGGDIWGSSYYASNYPLFYSWSNLTVNNIIFNGNYLDDSGDKFGSMVDITQPFDSDLGKGVVYVLKTPSFTFDFSGVDDTTTFTDADGWKYIPNVIINPSAIGEDVIINFYNSSRGTKVSSWDDSGLSKVEITGDTTCTNGGNVTRRQRCYIYLQLNESSAQTTETLVFNGNDITLHIGANLDFGYNVDTYNSKYLSDTNLQNQAFLEGLGFDFTTNWTLGTPYPYVYRND